MIGATIMVAIAVLLIGASIWFSGWSAGWKDASTRASRLVCKSPTIDAETKANLSTEIIMNPEGMEASNDTEAGTHSATSHGG